MIQQIIKAIDAKKSIPKVNVLDAMKMLTICWENVTEETVKKCFAKSHISPQDQTSAQDDLDDPLIELRNDLEKLKSLGVDEYPEEVSPEAFASLPLKLYWTLVFLQSQMRFNVVPWKFLN